MLYVLGKLHLQQQGALIKHKSPLNDSNKYNVALLLTIFICKCDCL